MSGLALFAHQFRYDQKAFWRNPASVFFTVMFPVVLLLIFATVLVVGTASFCCLGIALTALIPSQDAAAPIVNVILFPLYFLSGVFIPENELPNGVLSFADVFPVRHFFEAFFDAYVAGGPGSSGVPWGSLGLVALWGLAGLAFAIRFFRWTPRRG